MRRVIHRLLLCVLLATPFASPAAQEPPADDIGKLDREVQDAKADALDIAAELNMLEQRLLYPSTTRLTVTFALLREKRLHPGAVEIRLDDEVVAQHVYSDAEIEALRQGGVQTLYTGNVSAGSHELGVRVIGELRDGTDVERTARHRFTKGMDAKTLAITIDDAERDHGAIRIEDR